MRAKANVLPSKKTKLVFVVADKALEKVLHKGAAFLEKLAYASSIEIENNQDANFDGFASVVLSRACIYIPMDELVDKEAEKERLCKEKETLEMELKRVNGKLENASFMSKAPQDVVSKELEKKRKYQDMYNKDQNLLIFL